MEILFIVFVVAVAIQLFYQILFLTAFSRKPALPTQSTQPNVSIIVCAHDEEENLRELVPLLLEQDYPTFEIVIVNDRSNDGTFDWLIAETKKDRRLRMVHVNRLPEHITGKKYALTLGIKAALYEWVLLTDADCRPVSRNWIAEMSKSFVDSKQFVLGFSPYLKVPGFLNLFIRFESLLTSVQYFALAIQGAPYMGVGRNLAYRKSFFLEHKGFLNLHHIVGGDDDLYVNRHASGNNTSVCMSKDAIVTSRPKTTWKEFYRQKVRHLAVGKFYAFRFRVILGLFMLSWLASWVLGLIVVVMSEEFRLWAGGLLLFRCLMLVWVMGDSTKKMGEKFEVWAVPVLDFVFSIYYISTGVASLLIKKVRWKKN